MKSILLKLEDKLLEETDALVKAEKTNREALDEQLQREARLLKEYDPDSELKKDFELASLYDLKKTGIGYHPDIT